MTNLGTADRRLWVHLISTYVISWYIYKVCCYTLDQSCQVVDVSCVNTWLACITAVDSDRHAISVWS